MNELRNRDTSVIRLTLNGTNDNLILITESLIILKIKNIISNNKLINKLIVLLSIRLEGVLIRNKISDDKVIFKEYKHKNVQIIERIFIVLKTNLSIVIFAITPVIANMYWDCFEKK